MKSARVEKFCANKVSRELGETSKLSCVPSLNYSRVWDVNLFLIQIAAANRSFERTHESAEFHCRRRASIQQCQLNSFFTAILYEKRKYICSEARRETWEFFNFIFIVNTRAHVRALVQIECALPNIMIIIIRQTTTRICKRNRTARRSCNELLAFRLVFSVCANRRNNVTQYGYNVVTKLFLVSSSF